LIKLKRLFKKTLFQTSDTKEWFHIYEPTTSRKGSVSISDNAFKKHRLRAGGVDNSFAVRTRTFGTLVIGKRRNK